MTAHRAVLVVGGDGGVGARLAAGLARPDRAVSVVPGPAPAEAVDAASARLAAAGTLTAVVHAHLPPPLLEARPLADVPDAEWDELTGAPVRSLLRTLQAARRHLAPGGRIVVVVPAAALTGEAGFVALATAGEALRVLAKSAARSWGRAGVTVNAVAASRAALLGPDTADAADGAALPPAEGAGDVVELVALLLAPEAARLTGATLGADGGAAMAP